MIRNKSLLFKPEIYRGIKEFPKKGSGAYNYNMIFVECGDGKFRSHHHKDVVLEKDEIKSDVKNGYLVKIDY